MSDRVLLDTNALIDGIGTGRQVAVSVMSVAELRIGVLRAMTVEMRASRADRLAAIERVVETVPVDGAVAAEYARIVAILREHGRVVRPLDTIIAATAVARGVPVISRDADFRVFGELCGVDVREG